MPRLLRLARSSLAAHYRFPPALLALAGAVAAAAVFGRLHRFEVTGESMRPTLESGDRLLLLETRRVRVGDLVVVPDPRLSTRMVVKRVVGASRGGLTVRGDNPSPSTASRQFGVVPLPTMRGRVVYRYFPDSRRGRVGRARAGLVP